MGKARAILKRRKAVENIRKITRTMQLIATARFQGAFKRAVGARPFSEGIIRLVDQLAEGVDHEHPLLRANTRSKQSVHIVLSSNRGLCGGYNGAVFRAALRHIQERECAGDTIDLHVCGKKGISYFRYLGRPLGSAHTVFEDKPRFAEIEAIADSMISAYEREMIDSVYVTYTRFESASRQVVETIRLLPLERPEARKETREQVGLNVYVWPDGDRSVTYIRDGIWRLDEVRTDYPATKGNSRCWRNPISTRSFCVTPAG